MAMLSMVGVTTALRYADPHADPLSIVGLGSLVLLAFALPGLYVTRRVAESGRIMVWKIFDSAFQHVARTGTQAVENPPDQGPFGGIVGLLGFMGLNNRRVQDDRVAQQTTIAVLQRACETGLRQAQIAASSIRQDAGSLAETAAELEFAADHQARETVNAVRSLGHAEAGVDNAVCRLAGLTGSVRAITASAVQMSTVAANLSRLVQSAREQVIESGSMTSSLSSALDAIERATQVADSPDHPNNPEASSSQADNQRPLASDGEHREIARDCRTALDRAMIVIGQLIVQAADADRRAVTIGDQILQMREMGDAIGDAVRQQGDDIARTLDAIYEARKGFVTLRASIGHATCSGAPQRDVAEALRLTATRLPDRAERLVSLMRGFPDVASCQE